VLTTPTLDKLSALNPPAWPMPSPNRNTRGLWRPALGTSRVARGPGGTERENRRLERCLRRRSCGPTPASKDVDFARSGPPQRAARLARRLVEASRRSVGPTGFARTYIACALASAPSGPGHSALYVRRPRLIAEMPPVGPTPTAAGSCGPGLGVDSSCSTTSPRRSADQGRADLLEVIEDRADFVPHPRASSRTPSWHENLGEATIADAILDRRSQAHRMSAGESMRRAEPAKKSEPRPMPLSSWHIRRNRNSKR